MITKAGEHRGYKIFRQITTDFDGFYTEPMVSVYLGSTLDQVKATIDAMLDERPEEDVPFDEDLAGRLSEGK